MRGQSAIQSEETVEEGSSLDDDESSHGFDDGNSTVRAKRKEVRPAENRRK